MNNLIQASSGPFFLQQDTKIKITRIMEESLSKNTKRAYNSDLNYFWSSISIEQQIYPIPPELILEFIVYETDKADTYNTSIRTLQRRLAAISKIHELMAVDNPCKDKRVVALMRAVRKKTAKPIKKKALKLDLLNRLLQTCNSESLFDIRDRAILYFGFSSGGRRRSEIANAHFDYLEKEITATGEKVYIYNLCDTKTIRSDDSVKVPIKGKAATALSLWLEKSETNEGYIFRRIIKSGKLNSSQNPLNPYSINYIIKKRCVLANLNPDEFGAHSLRSGYMTEAARQGIHMADAMKLSTHKTVNVAMSYYEGHEALENPAGNLF